VPTAVFDLDGVIARGDTLGSLVGRRLRRRPVLVPAAVPLILAWVAVGRADPRRAGISRRVVRHAFRGLDDAGFTQLASSHGAELARRRGWVVERGVGAVRAAIARGDRVVIATASEERLARGFLEGVGLEGVEVIGTRLDFVDGRVSHRWHNFGAAKIDALRSRGVVLADAYFYTDSADDLPLAREVMRTILVNADAAALRRFRASGAVVDPVSW
jgi:phosphatidylglycerophosphatase C